ncbi:unnamed protein product [Pneumocystis jirovecii]|uniref:MRH domain-containing protein n=1 Tax=Pneumocystis jirovecii TaxID=42068 RepID=L0PBM1_PNEJI|nr:unnamed protein product [Pneumocystis jirovecii]
MGQERNILKNIFYLLFNRYNWLIKDEENNRSYSINICAPLIFNTTEIHEIDHENVSAIYIDKNETFSIGSIPSNIHFQGEKLVLQYENGSLCPGNSAFRKSTTISFICNPHMYKKPLIFFIADINSCAYFFEWHTAYACSKTLNKHLIKPGVVFSIILSIAFTVYCIGGCIYRSTIMYARGWKRVPHYGDIATAFFAALCSKIPASGFLKQDYNYIRHIDEENRLIDDILVDD